MERAKHGARLEIRCLMLFRRWRQQQKVSDLAAATVLWLEPSPPAAQDLTQIHGWKQIGFACGMLSYRSWLIVKPQRAVSTLIRHASPFSSLPSTPL